MLYHDRMNQINEIPKLYTAKQIAEILNVRPYHVYLLCRIGDIPYINIAPSTARYPTYRFKLNEIIEWWESKKKNE